MTQEDIFIITGNLIKNPLKKEELLYLLQETKKGNSNARNEIIEHNIKLVLYEVQNKFRTVEYEKQDLVSVGIIGLTKAVDTFKIDKNYEFTTYAVRCIDNEICMFLRYVKRHSSIDSLDRIIATDDTENQLKIKDILIDKNQDIIDEYNKKETYKIIRKIIYQLPEKEKEIILLNFGFYNNKVYTQYEIANKLNTSQATISKLRTKILKDITNKLIEEGIIISEKDINHKIKKLNK